jgi:hypothetical protein
LDRSIVDCEQDSIALPQGHHFSAGLHSRPLLGQDKLAASKIPIRLGQEDCDLKGERKVAIQILVQAIEVPGRVSQQQRRRTNLPGVVAKF